MEEDTERESGRMERVTEGFENEAMRRVQPKKRN